MCLLDYVIMFIIPDDVTHRCLSEYGKLRTETPSRCQVHLTRINVAHIHVAHDHFTFSPNKYTDYHPTTCSNLQKEIEFVIAPKKNKANSW